MGCLQSVTCATEALPLFSCWTNETQEVVIAAFLNCRHQVLSTKEIFRGGMDHAFARPREILAEALRQNAASLIVAHNHPSNGVEPSEEDVVFTSHLEWACDLLNVKLVDHLIVTGEGGYFSFAEARLLRSVRRRSRVHLGSLRRLDCR